MTDIERWSQQVAKSVNQIDRRTASVEQSVIQFINAQRAALRRESNDEIKAQFDKLLQSQHQYTAIVMVIGLGGLLTLWTTSFKHLTLLWFGLVGATLTFSILALAVFEVHALRYFANSFRLVTALEFDGRPANTQERADLFNRRATAFNDKWADLRFHLPLWPGVVSAVLLFSAYLDMILNGLV